MDTISEDLLHADIHDLKLGYVEDSGVDTYTCLICGYQTEKGIVYPENGVLYEAEKSMRRHIQDEHDSMLDYLLSLDKKLTGLTDLQRTLIGFFNQGLSDHDIIAEIDGGSTSTIRNHRFMLREKMKQAKLFLAVMELMEEGGKGRQPSAASSKTAQSKLPGKLGERLSITNEENEQILSIYFADGLYGPLTSFPKQEKRRVTVLRHMAGDFEQGRIYSEKEVNQVIEARYADFVTMRRYLIEYGFMDRLPDGSEYWVKQPEEKGKVKKEMKNQRRKELVDEYMSTPRPMGVLQIRNLENGKIYVTSGTNLPGAINGQKARLHSNYHVSQALQKDWKELGEEAFAFEILEELQPDPQAANDLKQQKIYTDKVAKMEKEWLEKLQPYDDKGYNKRPRADKL
ncbi:DUF2087 domain-containing protein [Paenibacillus dokdonensis]|uniref:DUF2087 domain-containing protein n=1 Tax=Paenibacillus dokdonensis TaxID=2567944 RepID=A0ABU6GNQ4_9BACL|nr:DUF2087 domain-containing protein [Paenibacillus dokdonensis]MEC0241374.1 DUF2087 domain-containing protein [Paenibacillus dokdonensis]